MRQLFLDCDGVLADFDGAGERLWGMHPRKYEQQVGTDAFWEELKQRPEQFFLNLQLLPDAMDLYRGVLDMGYSPKILSSGYGWIAAQKVVWGNRYFPEVEFICTQSAAVKKDHMKPGDILIDDYLKYSHLWVEAGGIFIHHTSAKQSLASLKVLQYADYQIENAKIQQDYGKDGGVVAGGPPKY